MPLTTIWEFEDPQVLNHVLLDLTILVITGSIAGEAQSVGLLPEIKDDLPWYKAIE
jgi:hypothetical protein